MTEPPVWREDNTFWRYTFAWIWGVHFQVSINKYQRNKNFRVSYLASWSYPFQAISNINARVGIKFVQKPTHWSTQRPTTTNNSSSVYCERRNTTRTHQAYIAELPCRWVMWLNPGSKPLKLTQIFDKQCLQWASSPILQKIGQWSVLSSIAETDDAEATMTARANTEERRIVCKDAI